MQKLTVPVIMQTYTPQTQHAAKKKITFIYLRYR